MFGRHEMKARPHVRLIYGSRNSAAGEELVELTVLARHEVVLVLPIARFSHILS